MSLVLVLASGPPGLLLAGERASLAFDSPRVVIGRGEGSDLRLPDTTVSLRHASLRVRGTDYVIVDEGSTNGTFVGSTRIAPQSPTLVKHGQRVRLGRVWVEVRIEPELATSQPALAAKALAIELVTLGLQSQGEEARPCVRVAGAAGDGLRLADPGRRYVIGRGHEVDLEVPDESASRRHVDVGLDHGQVTVRDLGSRMGATLGEVELGSAPAVWKPGVPLYIGQAELSLSHAAAQALGEIEVGPDEPMAEGEVVSPPIDPPREEPVVDDEDPPSAPAPIVASPRAPRRVSEGGGWGSTDLAVIALAFGILALSVAGLVLLFRS